MKPGSKHPTGYKKSGLELAIPTSVRIKPSEREHIETEHGSLTAAIRLLTKGGKYEQLAEQIELLTLNKMVLYNILKKLIYEYKISITPYLTVDQYIDTLSNIEIDFHIKTSIDNTITNT